MENDNPITPIEEAIANSTRSDIVDAIEQNELAISKMTGSQFLQLIKASSMRAAQYIYDKNTIYKQLLDERVKQSKYPFYFPFILTDVAIEKIDEIIKERISALSNTESSIINFTAQIDYQDGNSLDFMNLEDMLSVVSESLPISIILRWRYYQNILYEHNGISDNFQIPYDIILSFHVELNSNLRRELVLFSEHGEIVVEGVEYDWINSTLKKLTASVKFVKMPPWWSIPKYVQVKFRPFLMFFIWAAVANSGTVIFLRLLGSEPWYHLLVSIGVAYGIASVIYAISDVFWQYLLPPSMISIGDNAIRHNNNVLAIYKWVYGGVGVSVLGIVISFLLR